MTNITEILNEYTNGTKTLEETNAALKEAGADFHLNPDKNALTEEEIKATIVSDDPAGVTGFGLLDSGTGTMDKVQVKEGVMVNCDMGESYAIVLIGGKMFNVDGAKLVPYGAKA